MAASSPLVASSLSGLAGGYMKINCERSAPLLSRPNQEQFDSGKSSFNSSQIFGKAAVLGSLRASFVPRRQFSGHSAGVARCESADGNRNSLDIWLGRAAMLGFVSVVAVEIGTGKGVLENVGLAAPVPILALALTAVVGGFTAFQIFRSSNDS